MEPNQQPTFHNNPLDSLQPPSAVNDKTADRQVVVADRIHPRQGPMVGKREIWISGRNFPTDLGPLYVRFGGSLAHAVVYNSGLISCTLPEARYPGEVRVVLSRSCHPEAPVLGTSICQFEYVTGLDEMIPIIPRIQEDCSPDVAAALDVIHKEIMNRVLKRNANGSWRGVSDPGDKKSCWMEWT